MSNQICVRFAVSTENHIQGTVVKVLEDSGFHNLKKIVFILGFKPEKFEKWIGTLPQDGEVWICDIANESHRDDPDHGALFVHLLQKGTTIPARFHGLDIVFNADTLSVVPNGWDYVDAPRRYPVFGHYLDGFLAQGEIVSAIPEQEAKIRETLKTIRAYRGSIADHDPAIPMVFNGMTPEDAYAKIAADKLQERLAYASDWLEKQTAHIGQSVFTGGNGSYYCGWIETLIGVTTDERGDRWSITRDPHGVEHKKYGDVMFLSEEMVDWLHEMTRIALMEPVPAESAGYNGLPSDVAFPEMPVFSPHGNPEYTDRLESIRVVYSDTPQVRVKTKYMLVVIGGTDLDGHKGGKINLNPADIGTVGRVGVVTRGGMTSIPATVKHPSVDWYEAELKIRFNYTEAGANHSQQAWPMRAHVQTRGSIHGGGFVYEWGDDCPYEIPAEAGAAHKVAQQWALEFRKEE